MKRLCYLIIVYAVAQGFSCLAQVMPKVLPSNEEFPKVGTLPQLKAQEEVAEFPEGALTDSFGLPMYPPKQDDKTISLEDEELPLGELGKIVNKLPIYGVLAGQEVLIGTYPIPLGATFNVRINESESALFLVRSISNSEVVFGWSKDTSTYTYRLPTTASADINVQDTLPGMPGTQP